MARFGQTLTAMISPFSTDESLDLEGAQKLAKWLIANGNDGLVIAGTTGEAPTLTHDEQIALIEAVVDAVDVPVIAGTGRTTPGPQSNSPSGLPLLGRRRFCR